MENACCCCDLSLNTVLLKIGRINMEIIAKFFKDARSIWVGLLVCLWLLHGVAILDG